MLEDTENQPHAFPAEGPSRFYGNQPARVTFAAGAAERGSQLLCEDRSNPEYMWRVEASATNVLFRLTWGVRSSTTLTNLRSPLVAYVPGSFLLEAVHDDLETAGVAVAALTQATGGLGTVKSIETRAGVNVTLHENARRVTALTAVTVTVGGVAVVLAPTDVLEVAAPSVLTADGTVLVEYAV